MRAALAVFAVAGILFTMLTADNWRDRVVGYLVCPFLLLIVLY